MVCDLRRNIIFISTIFLLANQTQANIRSPAFLNDNQSQNLVNNVGQSGVIELRETLKYCVYLKNLEI